MTSPRASDPLGTALDVVAVILLSGLVLAALQGAYDGYQYLVIGTIAAVVATLTALVVHVQGHGGGVFVLVAVPVYLLMGAWVVERSFGVVGFPPWHSLVGVVAGTFRAAEEMLTTIPPIEATPTTLMLPWALGFLGAGTSAILAIRTARPFAPAMPFLVLLTVVLLLGVREPDTAAVRAVLVGVIVLAWGSARLTRAHRGKETTRPGPWGLVVRGVLIAGLGVGAATIGAPVMQTGERTTLRGYVGRPADVARLDNPLVSFRRYLDLPDDPGNEYDQVLVRLTGNRHGARLRLATLDLYDGTAWVPANRTVPRSSIDMYQRVSGKISGVERGTKVALGVEIGKLHTGEWLPTVANLTSIQFDFLDSDAQLGSVRFNPEAQAAFVIGGYGPGDDYTITAEVPTDRITRRTTPYREVGPNKDAARFLDEYLRPWLDSEMTPMQRLFSFGSYLKKYGYYSRDTTGELDADGHDPQRLGAGFLGRRQIVGTDEQYAAIVALAANRFGVPARVVVGAANPGKVVRGRDISAWVEIRADNGRWLTFGSGRFRPTRTSVKLGASRPDPERFVAKQRVADPEPRQEPEPTPDQHQVDPGQEDSGGHGSESRVPQLPRWLILAGIVAGLVPAAKWSRLQWRRRVGSPRRRAAGAWDEVVDRASDLGHVVPARVPRPAQARSLAEQGGLAVLVDELTFGADEPDELAVTDVWDRAQHQIAERRREASRWRRLRGRYDPRSLLPGGWAVRLRHKGRPRRSRSQE